MLVICYVGMFSLRKRIKDSVLLAEMLTTRALEHEVANHIGQGEVVQDFNMWDNLSESNELLMKLADSAKVVDSLQDIKYKVCINMHCACF